MLTLASTNTIQGSAGTASAITFTIFGMEFYSGVETYKVLAQGQLGLTVVPLYTAGSGYTTFVKTICLANTTGTLVTNIKLCVNGTAVGNQIVPSLSIPANGMALLDDNGIKVYDSNGNIYTATAANTNIFDNTTPLASVVGSVGSPGVAAVAARKDHSHQSPGGLAALTSGVTVSNTETQVIGATIPANLMQVGTTFRITATGKTVTTPSGGGDYVAFKLRIGSASLTGSRLGEIDCYISDPPGSGFEVAILFTVASNGTSIRLGMRANGDEQVTTFTDPQLISNLATGMAAINPTIQNVVELTAATSSSNSSISFGTAVVELVKL